jgi:Phage integrase family
MPLRIYKRGKIYHYAGTVAGRRLRGTCKTADKAIAQRIAAEKEARQWRGHLDGPGAVLTFAQAACLYRSIDKPARFLNRIEDYWRDTPVRDINGGRIRSSCPELYPFASGATWNRAVIAPTQAIINHAAEQELCPAIRVKRFPVTTKVKTPASWSWVEAFASTASPHLGALATFMFLTGARISEALSLTWPDVYFSRRAALIRQTKTGSERIAHLPPPLVAALANIPGERTGNVFGYASRDSARKAWNRTIARAGIKQLSYHSLRHGFATAALQAGIDVMTVAKLGGWKTPQHVFTTYGHATDDPTLTDRLIDTNLTHVNNLGEIRAKKSMG